MHCPADPDLTVDELFEQIVGRLEGGRCPVAGYFELTERCNLACIQCYINQPAGNRAARAQELTTAEAKRILDEMADAGCLYLVLTGGEVLLRPDFVEIYLHAKRKGMLLSIFTNGTLLTPRIADVLAEWPPSSLAISLYGRSQETYERITRVPGSYARCLRGIELAFDRRLRLSLKGVVLQTNYHELEDMKAFADQLGLKFRYDALIWPRLDGAQGPTAPRLPVGDILALDRDDPERREAWLAMHRQAGDTIVRAERVYTCGAGWRSFHVDCQGKLSACMMARRPAYDLRQGSFREGWEEFLARVIGARRKLDTPCRTCTIGALCIQCPGWSQLVHGDDETPVQFICELAHLRAAELLGLSSDRALPGPVLYPVPALIKEEER